MSPVRCRAHSGGVSDGHVAQTIIENNGPCFTTGFLQPGVQVNYLFSLFLLLPSFSWAKRKIEKWNPDRYDKQ